jgi:hypothetical protein
MLFAALSVEPGLFLARVEKMAGFFEAGRNDGPTGIDRASISCWELAMGSFPIDGRRPDEVADGTR